MSTRENIRLIRRYSYKTGLIRSEMNKICHLGKQFTKPFEALLQRMMQLYLMHILRFLVYCTSGKFLENKHFPNSLHASGDFCR